MRRAPGAQGPRARRASEARRRWVRIVTGRALLWTLCAGALSGPTLVAGASPGGTGQIPARGDREPGEPGLVAIDAAHDPAAAQVAGKAGTAPARGPLIMDRGPDRQEIAFPRDEELVYAVSLHLGVFGKHEVGKVTMSSRVLPYYGDSDPLEVEPGRELEHAIVGARAVGSYNVYSVDELIKTEFLPQTWPKLFHTSTQTGTENRRRELSIGVVDGKSQASYRGDRHCKEPKCKDSDHFVDPTFFWNDRSHCQDCNRGEHRVWKDWKTKEIPEGAIDMVSAVLLARTVVAQGKSGADFTLVDRDKLWEVQISKGRRGRHGIKAGTFDVVEVLLKSRPPAGEKGRDEDFQGLFGLHGNISIWMHPVSGVPVEITGTVPAGPLELDVQIELERYKGTPESFRKVIK